MDSNSHTNPQGIADLYDRRAGLFEPAEHLEEVRNAMAILKAVCPNRNWRILDVGCGEGLHVAEMVAAGYTNVHGLDISPATINVARERHRLLDVPFTCADIGQLNLGEFDLVTAFNSSFGSLGSVGDMNYLRGVVRALRPGGLFLLCYVGPDSAPRRVGVFRSTPTQQGSGPITTEVTITDDGRWMMLEQTHSSRRIPKEQIRIFREAELLEVTREAGLTQASMPIRNCSALLPYVDIFLGTKPAGSSAPG
jgi:SAM-dependent methyltransferase